MNRQYSLLILLSLICIAEGLGQSLDWNVSTGGNPGRNGLSAALGPVVEVGEYPEIAWLGGEPSPVSAAPLIEGDNLIVHRRWASDVSGESWIINYNLYTGEERWKTTLPEGVYDNYGKVSGVNNGVIYATRTGGTTKHDYLFALEVETGDLIWISEDTYGEHATESVNFTENGDIIAADDTYILRINKEDGTTIWRTPRPGSSSDGNSVSIYGDRGYLWTQNSLGMHVSACDLETGEILHSSASLISPGFQQIGIMVGIDGTVYAPALRNNPAVDSVVSLTDQGDYFEENWRYPIGFATLGNLGVGPDSSVYVFSRNNKLVRLDPETGSVLDSSITISNDHQFPGFSPTMAIGADGIVYLAVEDWPSYMLYMFTSDLELLMSDPIEGLKGVALGDSILIACSKEEILAFKGRKLSTSSVPFVIEPSNKFTVFPNPCNGQFSVMSEFDIENASVELEVINNAGAVIKTRNLSSNISDNRKIDISDYPDGIYFLKFKNEGNFYYQKLMKE